MFNLKKIQKWPLLFLTIITGLSASSFFVIPAILEQKYTNGYLYTKDLFYDHFPSLIQVIMPNFINYEPLRVAEVSVQIGIFHIIVMGLSIILLIKNMLGEKLKRFTLFILSISIVSMLLMNSITKPIWENISLLRQFQYPWRLLSILVVTTSLASSMLISIFPLLRQKVVYIVLVILVIISTAYYWKPPQGYQPISEKTYWNYSKSTTYLSELNSIWMGGNPTEYPKERVEIISGSGVIDYLSLTSIKHIIKINSSSEIRMIDRTLFYPGWKVKIDGISVPIEFQDINYRGLITFNVPTGRHSIEVVFTQSKLQQLSNLLSVGTIIMITLGYFFRKTKLFSFANHYIMSGE